MFEEKAQLYCVIKDVGRISSSPESEREAGIAKKVRQWVSERKRRGEREQVNERHERRNGMKKGERKVTGQDCSNNIFS